MFYQLPPAGNRVVTSKKSALTLQSFFVTEQIRFYESGTAALAASLCAAKKIKNQNNPCDEPEVILSAYACPDLVSAAVFAGLKPVLVDLEPERPWMDLAQLEAAMGTNTVAIIGVNLFGLAERWQQLAVLAKKYGVILIEDSAQYFPGEDEAIEWHGDLVVWSFGRGKPVSLLGGGGVLCRNPALFSALKYIDATSSGLNKRFLFLLKAKLYNLMISPYLYWLPQSLPFLHLGETRFHELANIGAIDSQRLGLLAENLERYQKDGNAVTCRENIAQMLVTTKAIIDLPKVCQADANRRLLRYPLLVDADCRENIYLELLKKGLGVSKMYPKTLPNIAGLEQVFEGRQRYPNAEQFASRLLTLSVPSCATGNNINKMRTVFEECL